MGFWISLASSVVLLPVVSSRCSLSAGAAGADSGCWAYAPALANSTSMTANPERVRRSSTAICYRSRAEVDVDESLGLRIDKEDGRRAIGALGLHQPAVAHLPDLVGQRVALGGSQLAHLVQQVHIDLALLYGVLRVQVLFPGAARRPLLRHRGCGGQQDGGPDNRGNSGQTQCGHSSSPSLMELNHLWPGATRWGGRLVRAARFLTSQAPCRVSRSGGCCWRL